MDERERAVAAQIRERLDGWNEHGLEWVAERWSDDLVWEEDESFPDGGVRRGRDEVVRRMRERFEALGMVKLEVISVDVALPRAIVEMDVHGEGSASGAEVVTRQVFVYDFDSEGRLIRLREFFDPEAARSAFAGAGSSRRAAGPAASRSVSSSLRSSVGRRR